MRNNKSILDYNILGSLFARMSSAIDIDIELINKQCDSYKNDVLICRLEESTLNDIINNSPISDTY